MLLITTDGKKNQLMARASSALATPLNPTKVDSFKTLERARLPGAERKGAL
ncbi:hypothetical protein AVEN_90545-1, partial [Araneus ventricosus]